MTRDIQFVRTGHPRVRKGYIRVMREQAAPPPGRIVSNPAERKQDGVHRKLTGGLRNMTALDSF